MRDIVRRSKSILLPFRKENHQSHDLNTSHCQNSPDHLASAFFYRSLKQQHKILYLNWRVYFKLKYFLRGHSVTTCL